MFHAGLKVATKLGAYNGTHSQPHIFCELGWGSTQRGGQGWAVTLELDGERPLSGSPRKLEDLLSLLFKNSWHCSSTKSAIGERLLGQSSSRTEI
jgi:hypothetical protein